MMPFLERVGEMLAHGVRDTPAKHNYRCSFDRDGQYLTSSRIDDTIYMRNFYFG
jgi:hypothetical protein